MKCRSIWRTTTRIWRFSARKQAEVKLAEYQAAGELKEKEYKKLKEQLDEYTKRMEGYHH